MDNEVSNAIDRILGKGAWWLVDNKRGRWVTDGHRHIHWCKNGWGSGQGQPRTGHYWFGVVPATLSADDELWVCSGSSPYLVPTELLRSPLDDPRAHRDSSNPKRVLFTIDTRLDRAIYGPDDRRIDLAPYSLN
jgi:hypothetical protein